MKPIIFSLLPLLFTVACTDSPKQEASSGKEEYLIAESDKGVQQSPIDIITYQTHEGTHEVHLEYRVSHEKVKNTGHSIEVSYDSGSVLEFDGARYAFKQFHFHTPSEHLIDGITYPMEMHMVHTLENDSSGNAPEYLVLGVLFKIGKNNAFIDEFLQDVPAKAETEVEYESHLVDVNDLLEKGKKHPYYIYRGSLTTPPYTESVQWLLMEDIEEAAPGQIERINAIEGNNARHLQALFGREVEKVIF